MNGISLNNEEKAIFSLRSLYEKYGYNHYKMSKFEEYDLYIKNKNFLVSDNIITFTDTDGKLMALKPDVTLSIIKNTTNKDEGLQKLYYNENVYRVSKGTRSFKEIMQTGLECMGDVDNYTIYEVLMLAVKSLDLISKDFIMDISHIGIVLKLLEEYDKPNEVKKKILDCLCDKNISAIQQIEAEEGIDCAIIKKLITTYGSLEEVSPMLDSLSCQEEVKELKEIVMKLEENGYKGKVHIDFSISGDMNYYNGFIFKGFVKGIPESILSGGQYDNLMIKMNRKEKAIGFAIYIDLLERLDGEKKDFDIDSVIIYDADSDIDSINNAIKLLSANGGSVMAQKTVPKSIRYKQLVRLTKKGVEILENNA